MATTQGIEEQVFSAMRSALPCVAGMVKFTATSAPVDCLVAGAEDGARFSESGRDPEDAGTIYVAMSNFPGLAADRKAYIIFQGAGTQQTVRVTQVSYKARAVVRLDYLSIHGKVAK